jgi:uncharacterized protein
MDMARTCFREGTPFGICLIAEGGEVGTPAVPVNTGVLARIDKWDMEHVGVLMVEIVGGQRFKFGAYSVDAGGLLHADVTLIEEDPRADFPEGTRQASNVLQSIAQKLPDRVREPHRYGDAGWVANRLAELLPIPNKAKQMLMEMLDPSARLTVIHRFLTQQGLQ